MINLLLSAFDQNKQYLVKISINFHNLLKILQSHSGRIDSGLQLQILFKSWICTVLTLTAILQNLTPFNVTTAQEFFQVEFATEF